jgi:hypothetical protein
MGPATNEKEKRMTTMEEYREALAHLRRFNDDPAFREELAKDFKGFGLSPQDIMIEELAAIGLRCLEARRLADDGAFARAVFPDAEPS